MKKIIILWDEENMNMTVESEDEDGEALETMEIFGMISMADHMYKDHTFIKGDDDQSLKGWKSQ